MGLMKVLSEKTDSQVKAPLEATPSTRVESAKKKKVERSERGRPRQKGNR